MTAETLPDSLTPKNIEAQRLAAERFLDGVLLQSIKKRLFDKADSHVWIPQLHTAFCKGAEVTFDLQDVLEVAEERNVEYQYIREQEPERFNTFTATRTVTAILLLEEVIFAPVNDDYTGYAL